MVKKTHSYVIVLCHFAMLVFAVQSHAFDTVKNTPLRNSYFTGRTLYLEEIKKKLSSYNVVYLTGYGGIGKSQLAKEYSYINEQKYDLIWWFDLKSDLGMQYESLLTHLSNSKKFKNLLHVNVTDIAPNVLIDFTNSLLSECDCNWLLIFDNVSTNKEIKLVNPKLAGQHTIITTREKQFFGKNVLTLEPFTNQEAEAFLSKVLPKEKKTEITKLFRSLYNYPLALAQISEEVLMYENGINSYLKKHDYNFSIKTSSMNSDITQAYNDNYYEILNITLQDIEQKDKEAADMLYMLALLNTELTKDLLRGLFGDTIEERLVTLSNFGVVQATSYTDAQIINIHDIIREGAVKKFSSKNKEYRKEIIHRLVKYFNNFYSEEKLRYLNKLDVTNNHIAVLHSLLEVVWHHDMINEEVVDIAIISLKLNNILFSRYASYTMYQQLANKIYNENINGIAPSKKALLYANLIFSDLIFESENSISSFEREMIRLLELIQGHQNYAEIFFIYTQMSQFYLMLGDLKEAKKYIAQAKQMINYSDSFFSLLQYWYTTAWLSYELRDIDAGMKAIDSYIELSNRFSSSNSAKLFAKNLRIKFEILIGQKVVAQKELEETIKKATVYYNDVPSDILGELEFSKALLYFHENKYDLAKKQCNRALSILKKVLDGDIIDLTQAHIHIMLGKVQEQKENYSAAIEEYRQVEKYYDKISYGRALSLYEYGELLANLCTVYYKLHDIKQSKFYYQKLVKAFGLEHEIVAKLIHKLPREYIYQIGISNEKS